MTGPPLQGLLLLADADGERAKVLAEAGATRGLATRVAAHGAAALEMALAEPPDVVVAAEDLPLVDAAQLAAILRANPRTQGTRFVLLGGAPGDPLPHGSCDARAPLPFDPDAVLRRVAALLGPSGSPRGEEGGEPAGPRAAGERDIEGKLAQLPLADLLQLFHLNRKTGTVELVRRAPDGGDERGLVAIADGNVVDARCGSVEGEKALHRLLGWRSGSFAFLRTQPSAPPRIHTPTRALLMEGMRQLDELARLQSELPPLDAEVRFRVAPSELPPVVQPLTREVLMLLRAFSRVSDLVDRSAHPDYQVLRTLQALLERGIVELHRPGPARAGAEAGALFSPAQLGRLREWSQKGRPRGGPDGDPRVLWVAPDPAATRSLLERLAALPDVRLEPAFREGRFSASTLAPMGRLGPPGEVGIELFHVPTHASGEPFWSLAPLSALSAVYVAAAPLGDVARTLAPVRRAMEPTLDGRCVWVALDPGPEALEAEEAAQALGVPGAATLLVCPVVPERDARPVLAQLLARWIP